MSGFRSTFPMNLLKSFGAIAIVGLAIGYTYSQVGTSEQFPSSACPLHQIFPSNCDASIYAAWSDHSAEMDKRFVIDAEDREKVPGNSSPYGKWQVPPQQTETVLGQ